MDPWWSSRRGAHRSGRRRPEAQRPRSKAGESSSGRPSRPPRPPSADRDHGATDTSTVELVVVGAVEVAVVGGGSTGRSQDPKASSTRTSAPMASTLQRTRSARMRRGVRPGRPARAGRCQAVWVVTCLDVWLAGGRLGQRWVGPLADGGEPHTFLLRRSVMASSLLWHPPTDAPACRCATTAPRRREPAGRVPLRRDGHAVALHLSSRWMARPFGAATRLGPYGPHRAGERSPSPAPLLTRLGREEARARVLRSRHRCRSAGHPVARPAEAGRRAVQWATVDRCCARA